jgi:integrase
VARGHITRKKRPDGTIVWIWRASSIDPTTGERHQPQKTFYTRAAADDHDAAWWAKLKAGESPVQARVTVSELMTEWLDLSRHSIQRTTLANYQGHCTRELAPLLGSLQVAALTPQRIQRAYADLLDKGYARGTVRSAHAVLSLVLDYAVERHLLASNPADKATRILKRQRSEDDVEASPERAWPLCEAQRFWEEVSLEGYGVVWALALGLGLRRGEALGARWRDLELPPATQPTASGRLLVTQAIRPRKGTPETASTKSRSGRRSVPVPAPLCALLRDQRGHVARQRAAAGSAWRDHDLVVCQDNGEPVPPDRLYHHWHRFLARTGLPALTMHGLRHTYGSHLILRGVPIPVVSKWMGHANPSTTLQKYAHVLRHAEDESVKVLTEMFWPSSGDESAQNVGAQP